MNTQQLMELDKAHVCQSYDRFPLALARGEGATLWSPEGGKYIDFGSGIGVCSVGHAHPQWIEAVSGQAATLAHVSNVYYNEPYAKLAQRLCALSGMKAVFFSNSGAEANEGAIKMARKYSFDKYGKGRSTIVSLTGSFHGRTVTTLSATGQEVFHNYFFPFTEGFKYVGPNDIGSMKAALSGDVCAVMLEPIQGEGGVVPLDDGYVKAVAALCGERDILLVLDEIQTGVGRTGSMFCFQQIGVTPDIMTLAKGLGGGLPIGAVVAGEKCAGTFTPKTHGSTFGGNPVSCAAACAVLDILENGVLAEVADKGEYITGAVRNANLPVIKELRGRGLMIGIAVNADPKSLTVRMAESGLLCLTAGKDVVRLLPPLVVSKAEMDEGLVILINTLRECGK